MNDIKIYCEDYDFSDLAAAFGGEVRCDCTLSAEIIEKYLTFSNKIIAYRFI